VRDHDGGFLPRQSTQSFKDQFFRRRVESRTRLVEDQDRRVANDGSRGGFSPIIARIVGNIS
jgi:hypothetical protein